MKLYVVINHNQVIGVFSDEDVAQQVQLCVENADIQAIELDFLSSDIQSKAQNSININLHDLIIKKRAGLVPMSDFDREDLMSEEEFIEAVENGMITSSDGDGYWATENEVSNISCFREKPLWANHVCWYNN